jgi:hypothetical protein
VSLSFTGAIIKKIKVLLISDTTPSDRKASSIRFLYISRVLSASASRQNRVKFKKEEKQKKLRNPLLYLIGTHVI